MRKLIFAVVFLLGVVFILSRRAEFPTIIDTLQRADWRFLLLALAIQVLWIANNTFFIWTIYRAMEIDEKLTEMAFLAASANFANIVAPTAGMSGIAVFISEARRKGFSTARATVANAVYTWLDYLAFMLILGLGLVVLFRRSLLSPIELIPTAILTTMFIIFGILLVQGMRSANALGKALIGLMKPMNRFVWFFRHRIYMSDRRAYELAEDAAAGLYRLRHDPRHLILPGLLALSGKVMLLTIFALIFLAFQIPFSPGTLIGGWSIGYLFTIVSPTPAGVGFMEGAMAILLTAFYVPLGAATVITLTYRAVTFWFPLFLGMLAFRRLGRTIEPRSPA